MFVHADTDMDGFVNGAEIKDIFLQSGLPQLVLAHIWFVIQLVIQRILHSGIFMEYIIWLSSSSLMTDQTIALAYLVLSFSESKIVIPGLLFKNSLIQLLAVLFNNRYLFIYYLSSFKSFNLS